MVRQAVTEGKGSGRGRYDRGQPPEARHAEQCNRLLDAAAEVFGAKGYAGATVEAIVSTAGMSRRTFYEHFDDLRDVLLRVHERAADWTYHFVENAMQVEEDPLSRVEAGIRAFVQAVTVRGDLARVVFRETRAAGPQYESRRELELARYASLLAGAVEAAHARGQMTRPPDEATVFALVAGMEAVAMRYLSRGQGTRALESAPLLIELVMRAFK
jgi:AcrR family transcriptional regulator